MNNIENTYVNYDELITIIGEKKINSRIEQIAQEMLDFINAFELEDVAYVNTMALTHAVMDYFSDIQRLKDYQHIEHINEVKIKAYETFWLLKRKPIQLKRQIEDDRQLYVNEKFLVGRLTSFMLGNAYTEPYINEEQKSFNNFINTLYYYLKFRRCDAQSLELILLAFEAGKLY